MTYEEALSIYSSRDDEQELTPEQKTALDLVIEVANCKPISRRQAKQQLLKMGLLAEVQAKIDEIADPVQKEMVQIYWDDSLTFERRNPMLMEIGSLLGLSELELNQAFKEATSL